MTSDERRTRLRALRQQEAEGSLTDSERAELDQIFHEMDAEEAALLSGATARLDAEIARVEAENAELTELIDRERRLVNHLRQVLEEAGTERRAIQDELARITGSRGPTPSAAP